MDANSNAPSKPSSFPTLKQSGKKRRSPSKEESEGSLKPSTSEFDPIASGVCQTNKSRTSNLLVGQRLEMVKEELENQKHEKLREQETNDNEAETCASQCQEDRRSIKAAKSTCRQVFNRLIRCDNLDYPNVAMPDRIHKKERHASTETSFLKIEAKVCYDLHKFAKGTLFVTSEMLTFLPFDDSNYTDQPVSLSAIEMPNDTLRSVALYKDPSVFFFIKRPRLSKSGSMKMSEVTDRATSKETPGFPTSDDVSCHSGATTASGEWSPDELAPSDSEVFLCCSVKNSRKVCPTRPNQVNSTGAQWFLVPKSKAMELHDFLRSCGPNLASVSPSEEKVKTPEKLQNDSQSTSSKDSSEIPINNSKPLFAFVSPFENLIPKLNADSKRSSGPISSRNYLGSLSHLIKTATTREKRSRRPMSIGSSEELFSDHAGVFESDTFLDSLPSPCTPSFTEEKEAFDMLRQSSLEWELISEEELYLRHGSSDKPLEVEKMGLLTPSSSLSSHILNEAQASELFASLPLRSQGLELSLKYSTERHGFSLKTLYRRFEELRAGDTNLSSAEMHSEHSEITLSPQNQTFFSSCQSDQPCLLLIKDSTGTVLGAYMNCPPRMSKGEFYGTGECFVFHWTGTDTSTTTIDESGHTTSDEMLLRPPKYFKRYLWSGKNYFFLSGEQDAFIIGCTDGKSAIRIDGDVLRGRSQACGTFDNPELTVPGDFFIHTLEVWAFV
ncbi:Nuclear receptor coactivator 7 [Sparganum proliferum]